MGLKQKNLNLFLSNHVKNSEVETIWSKTVLIQLVEIFWILNTSNRYQATERFKINETLPKSLTNYLCFCYKTLILFPFHLFQHLSHSHTVLLLIILILSFTTSSIDGIMSTYCGFIRLRKQFSIENPQNRILKQKVLMTPSSFFHHLKIHGEHSVSAECMQ